MIYEKLDLTPQHPVDILIENYIKPYNISASRLGKMLGVNRTNANRLLKKKSYIANDMAYRLAVVFETTPQYWLDLQHNYNIYRMNFEPIPDYNLLDFKTYLMDREYEEKYL